MNQAQRRGVALVAVVALMLMGCTPGWGGTADPVGHGPVLGGDDGGPPLGATPELDSIVLLGFGSTSVLGYLVATRKARTH